MSEQIHATPQHRDDAPEPDPAPAPAAPAVQVDALDEVLAGIDDVLQTEALTFVQDFRQQGGQ